jgi:DNA-directed RNA polymerase
LKRLFGVLNYLGSIPWKINTKVLKVVEDIWSEGGGVGEIPKRYSELITKYTNKLKL